MWVRVPPPAPILRVDDMTIEMLLILIWAHFIADFLLQTDKMALNKSSNNFWLGVHVIIYSMPFMLISWKYAVVNGLLHFITDFCTSRATSYLYKKNQRHWFFVVIGLDQAIHMTCLVLTYVWLI